MPYANWGFLALRLALGLIFVYHGAQKAMMPKMMSEMMAKMNMMKLSPSGFFVWGVLEFLAGLAVATGVYAQYGAAVTGIVALGAIGYKTMKWKVKFAAGAEPTGGWEFDLINLGASILVFLAGTGSYTLF